MSMHKSLKQDKFSYNRRVLKRDERIKRLIEREGEKPDSVFGLPKDTPEEAKVQGFKPKQIEGNKEKTEETLEADIDEEDNKEKVEKIRENIKEK